MDEDFSNELNAALAGDKDALGRLLTARRDVLSRRIGSRLKLNPYADFSANDVLQEVFVDVFQGINTFNGNPGEWNAWLFKIADNRLASMLRRRSRKKRGGDFKRVEKRPTDRFAESAIQLVALLADDAGFTPSQVVAKDEMVQAIQVGIAALPEDQREAMQQYFIEERNLDSTAEIMDKTDGAVRGLLHRAKKSLRDYLGTSTTWFVKQ